jgi:hypothetical protein
MIYTILAHEYECNSLLSVRSLLLAQSHLFLHILFAYTYDFSMQLAAQLNQAILVRKGLRSKSRLSMLLKRLIWEQEQLSAVASFPTLVDFDSCTLVPTEEIFDSHMDVSGE